MLPPTDIEFRVRYAETDQMGVVYHANYLVWCEMGRTDFIRRRGMSYADMEGSGNLAGRRTSILGMATYPTSSPRRRPGSRALHPSMRRLRLGTGLRR